MRRRVRFFRIPRDQMPAEVAVLSGRMTGGRLGGLELTASHEIARAEAISALDDYFAQLRSGVDAAGVARTADAAIDFWAVVRQDRTVELRHRVDGFPDVPLEVRRHVPEAIAAQLGDGVARALG